MDEIIKNPSKLEPFEIYKFVKISGDYLFAKQVGLGLDHKGILGGK